MAAIQAEVLRERVIARHLDPRNREVYREVMLRNTGKGAGTDCLLVLDQYLPGLWIEDGHGRQLTYLPRRVMEQEVGNEANLLEDLGVRQRNPDARVLVIQFAEPVPPDETVLLKLHFHDPESRGGAWWRLIPHYWFDVAGPPDQQAHDTFFEVEAPHDGLLYLADIANVDDPLNADGRPLGQLRRLARFFQLRSPGPAEGVRLRYRVVPHPSERGLIWLSYHLLWLVPLLMLVLAAFNMMTLSGDTTVVTNQGGNRLEATVAENRAGEIVAAIGIAGTVSIVAFLRPVWINRALYIWPFSWNALLLAASLK